MKPLKYIGGKIPCIKAISASVSGTTLTLTFPAYNSVPINYSGLILINVPQDTGSLTFSTTVLATEGKTTTQPLVQINNASVSNTVLEGNGVYLTFYDRESDILQML